MEQKIIQALTNPINLGFIIFMVILAVVELIFKKDFKSQIVSVGVLGTFVGIFVGLLDFDTHNLKLSIEHILEGLKTAFLTSIVGMGLAIILSVIEKFWRYNYDDEDEEFKILSEINEKLSNLSLLGKNDEKVIEELERLRLVNNDIKDEIKNINNDSKKYNESLQQMLSANFKGLNNSLALAIEHLSKGATEEIIKALKQVIEDFNQELQTQFGENFVKLNESVLNLLKWQENYKSHIENTEKALNTALISIENTKDTLQTIENSQKNINEVYKNLEEIIKTNKFQTEELNRHLETYKDLSNKSKEYLRNLDMVNEKFNNLTKVILENTDKQKGKIVEFIEFSTEEMIQSIRKNQEELNTVIMHFKQIEQEIPKALEVSLESLNNGLASLTRKFREDYENILNNYKQNL